MGRKTISTLLVALFILSWAFEPAALAQAAELQFVDIPELVRPGKTEHIGFSSPADGNASLTLETADGSYAAALQRDKAAASGHNSVFWDGMDDDGNPLSPGAYKLILAVADSAASADILIGSVSPQLQGLRISDPGIVKGKDWHISAYANMAGTLSLNLLGEGPAPFELLNAQVPQGELLIPWDGSVNGEMVKPGKRSLSLTLTDNEGFSSNPYHVVVEIVGETAATLPPAVLPEATSAPAPSPAPNIPLNHYKIPSLEPIPEASLGSSYWSLPVGEWNEDRIWQIMTQPLTVLEGRDQRETYKLRAAPDKSTARSNILGEITYVSQGVHVLETLDSGWSLVEAYNSSYGPDNRTRRGYGDTDDLIRGYVETSVLKQKTPRTDYGILIDKLKQEMYVFKDGKLFTTLIISTGVPTKQQPWNETPSGEYLMVSHVGDFMAGNLVCGMAMRINGGSLIHEVPYLVNAVTGFRDYTIQERQLGEKASHGCIRVQRKKNEDGVNMTWLWQNIKSNTKVLVWDDTGRFYDYPDDSLAIYFNPDRGQYYHSNQNCPSIRDVFLPLKGEITYAELDGSQYAKLTACRACNPPERKSRIDALNAANGY